MLARVFVGAHETLCLSTFCVLKFYDAAYAVDRRFYNCTHPMFVTQYSLCVLLY